MSKFVNWNPTGAPWRLLEGEPRSNVYGTVCGKPTRFPVAIAQGSIRDEAEANARLIVAAPDGLEAAEVAYFSILQMKDGNWRTMNQHVYCRLRDFIAAATGHTAEYVQTDFEQRVFDREHPAQSNKAA